MQRMPGNTGGSSGRPVGNMATNIASYETVRGLIAVIFFFCRFCFIINNYISVIAITFKDIRNCIPLGMLHVRLAATAKQPALTNSLSASTLVERQTLVYYRLSVN